jgi:hypothetical protein
MSINLAHMVDPSTYDQMVYDLVHATMDRTIELAAQADKFDVDTADEMDEQTKDGEPVVSLLRSQANFTPAEQSEFQLSGMLLNTLMGVCIARRAALYHQTDEPGS